MNAKAFYLAVGEIDDDLIQEADVTPAKSRRPFYRYLAAAACVCIAALALYFVRPHDDIRFNTLPAPPSARVAVQGGAVVMSETEAADYYGLSLPETLSGLARESSPYYIRYETAPGSVTYDVSTVSYQSEDGLRSLSVSISRAPYPSFLPETELIYSTLEGQPVLLAITGAPVPSYWAELDRGDTTLRVAASGFTEAEFVGAVRELARLPRDQ